MFTYDDLIGKIRLVSADKPSLAFNLLSVYCALRSLMTTFGAEGNFDQFQFRSTIENEVRDTLRNRNDDDEYVSELLWLIENEIKKQQISILLRRVDPFSFGEKLKVYTCQKESGSQLAVRYYFTDDN